MTHYDGAEGRSAEPPRQPDPNEYYRLREAAALNDAIAALTTLFASWLEALHVHPMPDYGDLYTMDEFLDHVRSGTITNDDGSAYVALPDGRVTGVQVRPSDVLGGSLVGTKAKIAWFNK